MTNAEKFKQAFGIYATELWSMSEEDFLKWLNAEAETKDWIPCSERLPKNNGEYLVTEKFSNGFPPDVCILEFAKDLYELDWHDFPDFFVEINWIYITNSKFFFWVYNVNKFFYILLWD